ncbi:MAG: prepilin peptidase [Candidatus Omnitrophica bacterium]|nr:prepilin peptidase [Candidatus Omnitrophota bacterium]MCM8790949.1 prepilin peptidase [Candidatus Omnitrophota bacterium]
MDRFFVFVVGSIIGSFLNVCIYRIPKRQSVVFPPSHCPHCKKNIHWYDNIPILSYIILGGRCSFCHKRIRPRYILIELLTAFLILGLFLFLGMGPKFIIYSALVSALIVVSFIDLEIQEIPDEITLGGMVIAVIFSFLFPEIHDTPIKGMAFYQSVAGLITGGALIYSMGLIGSLIFKKEAMGGGDIKLMAMIGAAIGWKLTVLTFFIAPISGAIVGSVKKWIKGVDAVPYGPHLALAAVISIFFGESILRTLACGLW